MVQPDSNPEKWMGAPRGVDVLNTSNDLPWRITAYRGKWCLIIWLGGERCRRSTGYDATPEMRQLAEQDAWQIYRQTVNRSRGNGQETPIDPRHPYRSGTLGTVYFVRAAGGGPIKIGWTVALSKRITAMQAVNPFPIEVIGTFMGTLEDEKRLHREFASSRLHGEWFEPTDALLKRIALEAQP